MTKENVNEAIMKAAQAFGFKVKEEVNYQGLLEIISEELNFTYHVDSTSRTDWAAHRVELKLTITGSVRKMGGQPTVEELLKTADEIKRGAELLQELQAQGLIWTEEF